ncbi:protein-export membrane protein SecF [candidate division WOR-1 bacterium RIFOXYA12_FULL_52_29]|uniref:Protein-export membrane protein SecF n=1 Tax=candidate division WOR-1 bacterium RIFOXYC12_FULL_54_18 TaxID=1802584 RepID=A0A1F4T6J1_UNCSA|nr:MAG: protein-export membrane protein SecF [candidate division WOR-1 bacterium RIFOXYA2_FULL_51_19]OGC17722.1 MAG: protein-export membrane protein SecF [candidate division WOR-1 bacterium RIFOXYA12_FULL_52_29]OGC26579.1 MAG: protein-export membrane protein SecF [candidate division WOR-1 bacterium RIFOXYB2_FULL_45_9]OGC28139.1 MAG: protein-export membrane protein SecF [candidate division WOR-1 bacterium RIFOXYC12_FULL_54_18]OGC29575.1 MAG: protein-export membrane protein SecF [candidate divisi
MFDVIKKTRLWLTLSGSLVVLAIAVLLFNFMVHAKPLNFGIDFTGGTMLNLRFAKTVSVGDVRRVLDGYGLGESVIQKAGENDILIRTKPLDNDVRTRLLGDFNSKISQTEILEADVIGPTVGRELGNQAIWALILASIGIIIYVSFRFEFKYAMAALIALYHDAIITTGIIALFWRQVDVTFVAAILTIMGYSINDTIVIFDRIRENLKKPSLAKKKFNEVVNISIWETMARSINTVLTVLFMVSCLLIFGGEPLREFSLTLLVGFAIGAYSSIFVAPPLLALWHQNESRK